MQRSGTGCSGLIPLPPTLDHNVAAMTSCAFGSGRRGHTLLELTLVLVIMGLTGLVLIRQAHLMMDRIEARNAVRAAGALMDRARNEAIAQQALVSVRIDTATASMDVLSRTGRISHEPLGASHGVTLSTTRDSVTYDVRGLGYGAANLTLLVRRGAAVESLVTSRLGRIRY